jgi:hypothetical protein
LSGNVAETVYDLLVRVRITAVSDFSECVYDCAYLLLRDRGIAC